MTDVDKQIDEIVSLILLLDKEEISDELRRKDYEPWDSMAHLLLVSEVESRFNIFLDDDEVVDIWTVGDLKKILASKL
ncbi:MAG: acyl carrier protein [Candidatus Thorarchaeota archaeon]|jgi:acyl carrier protein